MAYGSNQRHRTQSHLDANQHRRSATVRYRTSTLSPLAVADQLVKGGQPSLLLWTASRRTAAQSQHAGATMIGDSCLCCGEHQAACARCSSRRPSAMLTARRKPGELLEVTEGPREGWRQAWAALEHSGRERSSAKQTLLLSDGRCRYPTVEGCS